MEKYWNMTKDYIDSKCEKIMHSRRSNTSSWLKFVLAVIGIGVMAYTLICFLNKKKCGEKMLDHERSGEKKIDELAEKSNSEGSRN